MDIAQGAIAPVRPTILVVEDDPGVRRSLQLLLRAQGYEVKAYFESHPLLDEQSLDAACLVTDYQLGETDGLAVLSTMRERGWAGPAILITAFPSAALTHEAKTAGFDMVLEKPFRPHAFISAVQRLVAEN